jgi:hypothetical protein
MHQVDGDASPRPHFAVSHVNAWACSEPSGHLRIGVTEDSREQNIPDGDGREVVESSDVEVKRGRLEKGWKKGGKCSPISYARRSSEIDLLDVDDCRRIWELQDTSDEMFIRSQYLDFDEIVDSQLDQDEV